MVKHSTVNRILMVACAVLLAGNIGWMVQSKAETRASSERTLQNTYPLLSKRILADNPNDILINFVPLRKDLEARFKKVDAQKSFYFEYLPDGTSVRDGSDNELVAASLIKVPLCMNLYKAAELGRVDLDKEVTIKQAELDNAYGDLWKQGAGTKITLRKAAQLALEESDNTATHVIFDNIQHLLQSDEESLARLDIDQDMQAGQAVINAKSYSSVLKGLYFSAYLQKSDSEELLTHLTKSTATNRLAAKLPAGVPVAHKVGVNNANWAESDCGIVYVPKRPYVICVMVGLPEDQANSFIADISKEVYDFVSQH